MAKRFPQVPNEWQHFLVSVLLHLTLPLLPLILEFWFSGKIEEKSVVLTAAMYAIAIGLSSRSMALFAIALLAGLCFSAAFGSLSKNPSLENATFISFCVIGVIWLIHAVERYNRHVIDKVPFFEFLDKA